MNLSKIKNSVQLYLKFHNFQSWLASIKNALLSFHFQIQSSNFISTKSFNFEKIFFFIQISLMLFKVFLFFVYFSTKCAKNWYFYSNNNVFFFHSHRANKVFFFGKIRRKNSQYIHYIYIIISYQWSKMLFCLIMVQI